MIEPIRGNLIRESSLKVCHVLETSKGLVICITKADEAFGDALVRMTAHCAHHAPHPVARGETDGACRLVGWPAYPRMFLARSGFRLREQTKVGPFNDAQARQRCANRLGDITRREMRVVPFGHPGIRMAELSGDHAHRDAAHRQC